MIRKAARHLVEKNRQSGVYVGPGSAAVRMSWVIVHTSNMTYCALSGPKTILHFTSDGVDKTSPLQLWLGLVRHEGSFELVV